MREPYLWRTAYMSWRTCVVVKQMQSIHPSLIYLPLLVNVITLICSLAKKEESLSTDIEPGVNFQHCLTWVVWAWGTKICMGHGSISHLASQGHCTVSHSGAPGGRWGLGGSSRGGQGDPQQPGLGSIPELELELTAIPIPELKLEAVELELELQDGIDRNWNGIADFISIPPTFFCYFMSLLQYQITNCECLSFVILNPLEYNTIAGIGIAESELTPTLPPVQMLSQVQRAHRGTCPGPTNPSWCPLLGLTLWAELLRCH